MPIDMALADEFLAEFYYDYGHPALNFGAHDVLVGIAGRMSRASEKLRPAVRARLSAGLRQIISAGGAQCTPPMQARAADALLRLSGTDDLDGRIFAEGLLADALGWAEELQDQDFAKPVRRICAHHWGPSVWLKAYEVELARAGGLPEPAPPAYERALEMLRTVAAKMQPDSEKWVASLHEACQYAMHRFEEPAFEDDLVNRILVVLHRTLAIKAPRPGERALRLAERVLMDLVRERRIRTDAQGERWANCAMALGGRRVSTDFRRFLEGTIARSDEADLRCAICARPRVTSPATMRPWGPRTTTDEEAPARCTESARIQERAPGPLV